MITLSPLVSILLLLPPFAMVLFLPITVVVSLFIVFGQGHFIGSYIYQFIAGRLEWWRMILYAMLFILLWAVFISTKNFDALLALTAVVFSAHFVWDSSRILGSRELIPAIITRLPIFVLFSSFIVEKIYGTPLILGALLFSTLLLSVYTFCIAFDVFKYDISDSLFIGGALGFFGLITLNSNFSAWSLFGFIIIYHYLQWYVFYWKRYAAVGKARSRIYIRNILIANVVVISAFFLWKIDSTNDIFLFFFFEPEYFYIWTLVHIASSFKLKA